MKVLLSALYCRPKSGSEQAYGWLLATELAKDHDVVVLTGARQRTEIEAQMASRDDLDRLSFEYVPSLVDQSFSGTENRWERIAQYLWQIRAMPKARRIARRFEPDVAHHATSATWRQPSCLLFTGVPYAMGPMAGSERLPPGYARTFGWRANGRESLRRAAIAIARFDPLIRLTLRRARAIVASGPFTVAKMEGEYPDKSSTLIQLFPHPDIARDKVESRSWARSEKLRLVWAGRLVPAKGLAILIEALADDRLPPLQLDVLGTGPELENLRSLAARLGVSDLVNFRGHVSQDELFGAIRDGHLFVFTSLQELMGQALSEAMQLGIGCVIFDWTGASALAGADGAVKVPVGSPLEAPADLANALLDIVENGQVEELSLRARKRIDEVEADASPLERFTALYERVRTNQAGKASPSK